MFDQNAGILRTKNKSNTLQSTIKKDRNVAFDFNIEALRGFAALFVAIGHAVIFNNILDPNFFSEEMRLTLAPGHYCVLIFFVLSGYVIGISNKKELRGKEIGIYLKKRLVRLYPIYIVCFLFALLVSTSNYSFATVLSHITITQVAFAEVILENGPLWSLHYEVLYYMLFILISAFRINPLFAAAVSIGVGLLNFVLFPSVNFSLISSYSFGFTFWIAGLAIAKYFTRSKVETNYALLASNVFLVLSIYAFNILSTLFLKLSNALSSQYGFFKSEISFHDLSFLPYAVLFILIFSGKQFKYKKQITLILQLLPAATFIYLAKNYGTKDLGNFLMPSVFYLISLVLFFSKSDFIDSLSKRLIKCGVWLGSISYAVYVLNFPLLFLFNRITIFSGSPTTYIVRIVVFLSSLILLSYLLEKKFQPWIRAKFF